MLLKKQKKLRLRLLRKILKKTVKEIKKVEPIKVSDDAIYATGRRKESTAKVWLFKGSGVVKINHLEPLEYLSSERLVDKVLTPLST